MADSPLLIMFVGIPGSGKTTFARQLAKRLDAVILSSDSIRIWMWGSRDAIPSSQHGIEEKRRANKLTFGAMNYAANQVLSTGRSVIYDCNANHISERQEKHDIAKKQDAVSVVIRIKVPYEVSLTRVQLREDTHDQRQMPLEKAQAVLKRFLDEIEEPTAKEKTIFIDGQQAFEQQIAEFQTQLTRVLHEPA